MSQNSYCSKTIFQIGEGSFGEVFLLPPFHYNEGGNGAVLKIVPIDGDALVNGDAQTKLAGKNVKWILVTHSHLKSID